MVIWSWTFATQQAMAVRSPLNSWAIHSVSELVEASFVTHEESEVRNLWHLSMKILYAVR